MDSFCENKEIVAVVFVYWLKFKKKIIYQAFRSGIVYKTCIKKC